MGVGGGCSFQTSLRPLLLHDAKLFSPSGTACVSLAGKVHQTKREPERNRTTKYTAPAPSYSSPVFFSLPS